MKTAVIIVIIILAFTSAFLAVMCLYLDLLLLDTKIKLEAAEEVLELGDIDWKHDAGEDTE